MKTHLICLKLKFEVQSVIKKLFHWFKSCFYSKNPHFKICPISSNVFQNGLIWKILCPISFNEIHDICFFFICNLFYLFQTRQTVEKLQGLVSSDGRFRNLRDSLHRTDPPCIPYLGMYLSDLTFIEEGTPNFTDNGLLNFAKMRMVQFYIKNDNSNNSLATSI